MTIVDAGRVLSGRWQALAAGSTNRRILSALVLVGGLTFAVKVASMLKDAVVAASFGTGNALDAFFIAFVLPTYLTNVVALSFNAAFVPVFIQVREQEGREAAQRLFSGVVVCSVALLAVVTWVLVVAGPPLLPVLGSGFNPAKLALTQGLFYALLPMVVITGLVTIWGALLNAGERFGLAALAPGAISVASIAALLLLAPIWGAYALAAGIIGGMLLQLALLAWGLRRQGIGLRPRWYGFTPAMRRVLAQYLPALAGGVVMNSTPLVDQAFAAMLPAGSVSALNYGNKLVALAVSIGTVALGTAVLPYFSKMAAARDWPGVRHSLRTYTRLILAVTIPCTIACIVLSAPIVHLLFERGAFTAADTAVVSRVQAMYLLQIPFYTLGILFVRLISSLQANQILFWSTLISWGVNIGADYGLLRLFGIPGIALSTSLVYVVACGFLGLMLFRRLAALERTGG